MRNYEVTLLATVRKTIGVRAPDVGAAMDKAADSIDTTDLDLGDWEILTIEVDDAEELEEG
jgi:hypothetical protein